jgi:small-conductance mechanosensitive channel/CRP-like cAMP-binding protein
VPPHPSLHFVLTIGLLAATLASLAIVRSAALKRRLTFAGVAFVLAAVLHGLIHSGETRPALQTVAAQGPAVEYMLIAFGVIAGLVALAFNPWRQHRHDRGVPSIVQDALLVVLSLVAALFFFQNSNLIVGVTGSAIVFGLALQDTLGNAFAGLALQVERPFRVGHWVTVADHEGRVIEVTWRATKIETKSGNLVVLPNSEIAKAGITNYSQPTAPTRLHVEIGASYSTPPNETRDALLTAMRRVSRVLKEPAPDVLLADFGASALIYHARFWTPDYQSEEVVRSEVRTAIYYELGRRGIEIPFPIQIEYGREDPVVDRSAVVERAGRMIASVPVFAGLPEDARRALAESANTRLFADGEQIVREGEPGGTMYLVTRGRVVVTVGAGAQRVAVTEAGGYFGEMSLLTGEPRTATVTASGDCTLLEIAATDFRSYVQSNPGVIEDLATAAAARRKQLDATKAVATGAASVERQSLVSVMRQFFGLE